MHINKAPLRFFQILATLIPATLSAGTILYSDINPVNFAGSGGYNTGFSATTFTTTAGGELGAVTIGLLEQGNSAVTLGLYTDSSGLPGALLESWSGVFPYSVSPILTTLISVQNPVLSAATPYWLVAEPPGGLQLIFDWNNEGVVGGLWVGPPGFNTSELVPYSTADPTPNVELTAVREPVSLIPLGLSGIGLWLDRRRRRNDSRTNQTTRKLPKPGGAQRIRRVFFPRAV